MKKIALVDFNDSFTYTLWSSLCFQGLNIEVICYKELKQRQKLKSRYRHIILGPGPGSIFDYRPYFSSIITLSHEVSFFGVCLGHQILSYLLGNAEIRPITPVHGMSVEVVVPAWDCFHPSFWGKKHSVARYNSWGVFPHYEKNSAPKLFCRFKNHFSVQFHPESVGTTYPHPFYGPLGVSFAKMEQ